MTLVPGNNPIDVDARARERTAEHERQVASGTVEREAAAARHGATQVPPSRRSIVDRVRSLVRRR